MAEAPLLLVNWDIEEEDVDYNGVYQSAYRIMIYRNGECVYDSGKSETSDQTCEIIAPPEKLATDDEMFLSITLWDIDNMLTDTVTLDL